MRVNRWTLRCGLAIVLQRRALVITLRFYLARTNEFDASLRE